MPESEREKYLRLLREDGDKYQAQIIAYIEELKEQEQKRREGISTLLS